MQRAIHPDLFGQKSAKEQSLSADASSQVNAAYRILRAPATRAQYLLQLHGIDAIGEGAGSGSGFCDPALLLEVMEARETLADAADAAQRAQAKLKELAAKANTSAAAVSIGSSGTESSGSRSSSSGSGSGPGAAAPHVHGPGCGHDGYEASSPAAAVAAVAPHVHGPGCGHPEHGHSAASSSSSSARPATGPSSGSGSGAARRPPVNPEVAAAQAVLHRARSAVLALDKSTAAQLRETVADLETAFDRGSGSKATVASAAAAASSPAAGGRDLDAAARLTVRLQYLTKLSNEVDDWLEAYGRSSPAASAAAAASGAASVDPACGPGTGPGSGGGSAVSRLAEQILSEKAPPRQTAKAKAS